MNMGNELIRLCSTIERHGLVDYEYGVWEERIIDGKSPRLVLPLNLILVYSLVSLVLGKCLDAHENSRLSGVGRSSQQGSSRIGST